MKERMTIKKLKAIIEQCAFSHWDKIQADQDNPDADQYIQGKLAEDVEILGIIGGTAKENISRMIIDGKKEA